MAQISMSNYLCSLTRLTRLESLALSRCFLMHLNPFSGMTWLKHIDVIKDQGSRITAMGHNGMEPWHTVGTKAKMRWGWRNGSGRVGEQPPSLSLAASPAVHTRL